ncbi:MAG TPA: hypothetical protein VI542_00490 [Candidatus Tectomicrobia bacterium]
MATPRTTFIVASDRDGLILEKLAGMEQAIESLVPLLEKILTQLEVLTVKAPVPMATYADLYDVPEAGPPEGELVAESLPQLTAPPGRWWTRLLRGPS